jgi:hypothetical protein
LLELQKQQYKREASTNINNNPTMKHLNVVQHKCMLQHQENTRTVEKAQAVLALNSQSQSAQILWLKQKQEMLDMFHEEVSKGRLYTFIHQHYPMLIEFIPASANVPPLRLDEIPYGDAEEQDGKSIHLSTPTIMKRK